MPHLALVHLDNRQLHCRAHLLLMLSQRQEAVFIYYHLLLQFLGSEEGMQYLEPAGTSIMASMDFPSSLNQDLMQLQACVHITNVSWFLTSPGEDVAETESITGEMVVVDGSIRHLGTTDEIEI